MSVSCTDNRDDRIFWILMTITAALLTGEIIGLVISFAFWLFR